ncbi:MAG: AI-2E family transporter [Pseudomonadota bacterium]|nr:AI-2E family transporter [Pseudomonadota bacterium]
MKAADRIRPETRGVEHKIAVKKSLPAVTSLRILVVGGLGLLLYFAHVAFIPLALALLLALILSGPVEALRRWHVPRAVSAALLLMAIIGLFAALVNFGSEPAQKWFAVAPHTVRVIEKKIRPLAQLMARIGDLRNSAANLGNASRSSPQTPAPVAEESAPVMLLDVTRTLVLSSVTVIILTLFLLSGGPPMLARMVSAGAGDLNSARIIGVIEKVRSEVGRFYVTTAMINVGLGTATALAMLACGMPNPFLWGLMAALLNFIPYAGSTTTLIVVTLVAIMSFDTLVQVLAVAGSYLVLATIEGQIVQPLLVGRRLELNPMLVFLALWFGGFFWGIPGIILATPSLVALKVIAENAEHGRPVLEFLSPNAPD